MGEFVVIKVILYVEINFIYGSSNNFSIMNTTDGYILNTEFSESSNYFNRMVF